MRDELKAAQEVNDPERVLEIHAGLASVLTAEVPLAEVEGPLVKWFLALIMRRLRGGTVRPDVADLAAKVAERFPKSVEGASLLGASLATLRRSRRPLARRVQRPYRGIADACPLCLAAEGSPPGAPVDGAPGSAWEVEPPAEEDCHRRNPPEGPELPRVPGRPNLTRHRTSARMDQSHASSQIVRAGNGKDRAMTRHLALAWVGLVVAAGASRAQVPLSKDLLPSQRALARLGLERHWYNVIPLSNKGERVLELSIGDSLVFVQTNQANFHIFDGESGRRLWTTNLGSNSVDAKPSSANSTTVFVTNSNVLYALDRTDGRVKWSKIMEHLPASATSCDEEHVYVGLRDGKLVAYDAKDSKELWNYQARNDISSRPEPAGRVVAFASTDGKVYVSRADISRPLLRWTAAGPISAPLNALGVRTLLVPSQDKSLYAIDLWTGETRWVFPTGAPILQEPLVAGDDIYVVNSAGMLSAVNSETGASEWTISTLGGPLLGVTPKRLYLESIDGDLFIVDRTTG